MTQKTLLSERIPYQGDTSERKKELNTEAFDGEPEDSLITNRTNQWL